MRVRWRDAALASLLPATPDRHEDLAQTALALVADPALAFVFGAGVAAEVPILAKARRDGEEVLIAGRIDRLVVTTEAVTIVDFKSDARPPADAKRHSTGLCRPNSGSIAPCSAGIFPDKTIGAAVLWTRDRKNHDRA